MGNREKMGRFWVDALKVASQIHFVQHDRWGARLFLREIGECTPNRVTVGPKCLNLAVPAKPNLLFPDNSPSAALTICCEWADPICAC